MKEKLTYGLSVALGGIAVALLIVNVTIANANRTLQSDVAQRQNTITTGQAIGQVNQGLVQAMAEAAVKNNNTAMRDLLQSQGITVRNDAAPAAAPKTPEKK